MIPLAMLALQATTLVRIGVADGSDAEFALAPSGYAGYRQDPVYVEGRSTDRDWPYVLPGPSDAWAGSRPHQGLIAFGIGSSAPGATCRAVIDFVETHPSRPPRLEFALNDVPVAVRQLAPGNGDDAVEGHPERGKHRQIAVELPAKALRVGNNRLAIRNAEGSWAVFDALRVEATGVTARPVSAEVSLRALPQEQAVLRTSQGPCQTVRIEATNLGPPATHRFVFAGETRTVELATGTQSLSFAIPSVPRTTTMAVCDLGGATAQVTVAPVRPWTVLLFPHAHVDVGYTDLQADVERNHRRNLFDALTVARESASNPPDARYRYNIEAAWVLERFLRNATADEKAQVRAGLRRGDLAVTGGYANELTAAMRPEEMMQAYRDSRRLEDAFGVRIDTASQTDVPGVSWGDVTALHEAKIDNLVLMPNGGDRVGTVRRAWEDRPFYWISPSGKASVFVWETTTYGMAHAYRPFDGHRDRIFRTSDPTAHFVGDYLFPLLAKYAAQRYPYDLLGIPWSVNDNSPIDGDVPTAVKAWNERYVWPHIRISTLSEGCREFKARYGTRIPRVRGDLTPYWEDGVGSSARETAMNRASADRLVQDATLEAMFGPESYRPEAFFDAWRNVLLYTEHTWGAYNSISEPDSPFVRSQWAVKRGFAEAADRESRALAPPPLLSPTFDVVNTVSWPRTDLVTLSAARSKAGDRVVDERGTLLPSQRLRTGELAVLVRDVPAFGCRRIRCVAGPAWSGQGVRAKGRVLSGVGLSVALDPETGGLASWRQNGREWVEAGKGLNAYGYLLGTNAKDLQGTSNVRFEVVEPGPLVASIRAVSDAPGTSGISQTVRIVAGLTRVEIEDAVDKKAVRAKEGVHFAFPFSVPGGQVRIDTPWAVVRPEIDQLPGANKNWFCTQRFVDVSNGRFGVTLSSLDAPLIEVGGLTANLLGSVGIDEWRKHVEPTSTIFSWAMNNHWHTNYRAEQEGAVTFRYALDAHGPYAADAASRFGTALAQPLLVRPAQGPIAAPLLSVSDPGVLATSLTPSDDGRAFVVRLYGASGKDRRATLRWRAGEVGRVSRTDLSQRPGMALRGAILVPGNGVVTLRAERLKGFTPTARNADRAVPVAKARP